MPRYELGITYLRDNQNRKELWLKCHILFNDGILIEQVKAKKKKIKFDGNDKKKKCRGAHTAGAGQAEGNKGIH